MVWKIFKSVQGIGQIWRYEYGSQQCEDSLYILAWIKSSGENVKEREQEK